MQEDASDDFSNPHPEGRAPKMKEFLHALFSLKKEILLSVTI